MKLVLVVSCILGLSLAVPADQSIRELPALRHEEVHDEFGQYALRYITAENTVVSERGRLIPSSNGGYVLAIDGQYEFLGDDGKPYTTTYSSGAGGFQVQGQHLPQPVPVPVPRVAI